MPDGAEDWRARGQLFDAAAEEYQDGRPGYPPELFDLLRDNCGLGPGSSVLEVGPGAGQATVALLDRGARVTAVEPGANFVRALERRTAGRPLTTVVATFEDADVGPGPFDLVVSATAFHWVRPEVGFPKAAGLLSPGGWVALWWTLWADPTRPDPFNEALQTLLAATAPQLVAEGQAAAGYALDTESRLAEFRLAELLAEPVREVVSWTGRHDAQQTRALFATFSPFLALAEPARNRVLDQIETLVRERFDGVIERPYQTVLFRARRLGAT